MTNTEVKSLKRSFTRKSVAFPKMDIILAIIKKKYKKLFMKNIIFILVFSFLLASCGDKFPKFERKACTDAKAKTVADALCKKN